MKCKECGNVLDKNWNFCPYCQTTNSFKIKHTKKKKIIGSIILLFFIILIFVFISKKNYWSSETKNDDQIETLIQEYFKEKYNENITLKQEKKELKKFCVITFPGAGCTFSINNKNIYEYTYAVADSKNNNFQIKYTNPYFGNLSFHKFSIDESYDIINNLPNIEQLIQQNFQNYKVYASIEEEFYHIIIYDPNINYNELNSLFDKLSNNSVSYSVLIINDYNDYQKLLNNDYRYKHTPGWDNLTLSKLIGYKDQKSIKIRENKLPNINILDQTAIVFMGRKILNTMWIFNR